jgi:hypothetical protein
MTADGGLEPKARNPPSALPRIPDLKNCATLNGEQGRLCSVFFVVSRMTQGAFAYPTD